MTQEFGTTVAQNTPQAIFKDKESTLLFPVACSSLFPLTS